MGDGWGLSQPKQCAGFPAHRLKIPPQVPLAEDGGAAGGSAVGRPAHGLPAPRAAQQREAARHTMSGGAPAADVPPRTPKADDWRVGRAAANESSSSAARLRVWRGPGVSIWTEHSQRSAAEAASTGPVRQAGERIPMTCTRSVWVIVSPAVHGPGKGRLWFKLIERSHSQWSRWRTGCASSCCSTGVSTASFADAITSGVKVRDVSRGDQVGRTGR